MPARRRILLVQLPIPPVGREPIRGNVPLAAGYLKLLARLCGLEGVGADWMDEVGEYGTLVWRGAPTTDEEFEAHEYTLAAT